MSKAEGCEPKLRAEGVAGSEAISNKEENMAKSKVAQASHNVILSRSCEPKAWQEAKNLTKEGLPKEAFAIVGDPQDPETWKLPHHTKTIYGAIRIGGATPRLDIEKPVLERSEGTVDWDRMPAAVAALSRGGYRGERVRAEPGEIIKAAQHLAGHYQKAGKSVPDTLGVLI